MTRSSSSGLLLKSVHLHHKDQTRFAPRSLNLTSTMFLARLLYCSLLGARCLVTASPSKHSHNYNGVPTVKVRNGTLEGRHVPEYGVDYFLGVPYAQPPLGPLRFRRPQALNKTFDGVWDATELPKAVCPLA